MKSEVIIQIEIEGFHNYPNPPQLVKYLQYVHRHTFTIKCGYLVTDPNREKEIFICRDKVKEYLEDVYGLPCSFENMSCEMIAEEILNSFIYDGMTWAEVWEENTGGARVEK